MIAGVLSLGLALLFVPWQDWSIHRAIANGPAVPGRVVGPGSCDGWWRCGRYEEAWRVRFRTDGGSMSEAVVVTHRGDYERGSRITVRYDPGNPAHAEDAQHGSRVFPSLVAGALLLFIPLGFFLLPTVRRR